MELADELKTLRVKIENNEKSEFDFFRYAQTSKDTSAEQDENRSYVRKRMKLAVAKYFKITRNANGYD